MGNLGYDFFGLKLYNDNANAVAFKISFRFDWSSYDTSVNNINLRSMGYTWNVFIFLLRLLKSACSSTSAPSLLRSSSLRKSTPFDVLPSSRRTAIVERRSVPVRRSNYAYYMLLTLLIQYAVLFLNLLDILLVFGDLATQRLYAFGGLFQYLCSTSLKYDRGQIGILLLFQIVHSLTFSPLSVGTASRKLVKLSLMWSLLRRSSALWCARFSALKQ